jgi:hypothetical protein
VSRSVEAFAGIDPRFSVQPKHLFGPFYSVRVFDRERGGVEVFVTGGGFLTGWSSVRRAARLSTARYLMRDGAGRHEQTRRAGY